MSSRSRTRESDLLLFCVQHKQQVIPRLRDRMTGTPFQQPAFERALQS